MSMRRSAAWARMLLLPLVPLYRAGLAWKNSGFDAERSNVKHLQWPVVSVGSLSAGGAGKTPVVMALARVLSNDGYNVDILTRGYGRTGTEVERVDTLGDTAHFGDEAMLLAKESGVPVFVGAERYEAGLLAERTPANAAEKHIHLLDDGFQHRRLARSLDVVLLTEQDAHDWLLPAGNLREPLSSLRRAGVLVVRAEEAEALRPVLKEVFGDSAPPIWVVRRSIHLRAVTGDVEETSRPFAFCGVARPEDFFAMLRANGTLPAATVAFHDHYAYAARDVDSLLQKAVAAGADGWVMTAKDAVKLTPGMVDRLQQAGPVVVAELDVAFDNEAEVQQRILAL
jgi:tetraacyldisaccharide 4'-kinase